MRRGRGGSMAIELAMWLPILFLLIGGLIQFGKITYIYYSLQKTMNTVASYLAVQNGVNFCPDASDPSIAAPPISSSVPARRSSSATVTASTGSPWP